MNGTWNRYFDITTFTMRPRWKKVCLYIVGNKAKQRISKRVFQDNGYLHAKFSEKRTFLTL